MSNVFSASTKRELLALRDHGAPVRAILGEVSRFLGDPKAFKEFTDRAATRSGTPADIGAPKESGTMTFSKKEKRFIRNLPGNLSPERIAAMSEDATYEEWQELKAQEGR